jgi:hypothetical protein
MLSNPPNRSINNNNNMSRSGKQSKRTVAVKEAAFCKACKDAGKHAHIYESHFTRDVRGKVCCPTILENVCNKCGCKGHFSSYCVKKAEANSTRTPWYLKAEVKLVEKPAEKAPVKSANVFDALYDSDSSETSSPRKKAEEEKVDLKVKRKPMPKNWADWSDSEDEDC